MAYSFQPLDQALDSLGKSYIDGVTVKIASKYRVDYDLQEVRNILNNPAPSVLSFESNYDTSYEKKVLEDIKKRSAEKLNKDKERQERIEKYQKEKADELAIKQREEEEKALEDERKMLLEIEAEKKTKVAEEERKQLEQLKIEEEKALQLKKEEEAEWKKFEEERLENMKVVSSKDTEVAPEVPTDKSSEDPAEEVFSTPPEEAGNLSSKQIHVKGIQSVQTAQNLQINFSDFEALSDPFADLELQTINDLAELQTILTSNQVTSNIPGHSTTPALATQYSQHTFYSALSSQDQFTPNPSHLASQPNFGNFSVSSSGYSIPSQAFPAPAYRPYPSQPYPSTGYSVYTPQTYPPPLTAPQATKARSISSDRRTEKLKDSADDVSVSGELKPSRSVGDLISSLQAEAQSIQDQRRKSPKPSNSRPGSRGATGLENWTPWPQLLPTDSVPVVESCLSELSEDKAKLCLQLHEMGFPLPRLAKGCQAVGGDSQKLINFCLVVDRLVDEGFSTVDSEDVAMLHNADEEVCRKHLKSFQQLAELGFPSKDVHQALLATNFDHQKALEQLIK